MTKIIITALTIGGSISLLETKRKWFNRKVDSFNTIKIAGVTSSWVLTKENNVYQHILEYEYPPKQSDITKCVKGIRKAIEKDKLKEFIDFKIEVLE